MTPPTERERKWLEQVAGQKGFDLEEFDSPELEAFFWCLSEVLTKTKEACAQAVSAYDETSDEHRRIYNFDATELTPGEAISRAIRNLEITGD